MILIWTDTLLNTLCLSPCPPNSMLACATDIPTCEIDSGRTHPHSCESNTHINIEIGGEGGKSSSPTLRHLLNSTCEISSVTSSHLTLQQHNAVTRRVAPGRGGTRAAPWRAAKCCGNAIAPAGPRRVTERRKRRVACADPFRTRAAAAQPQRRRGGGAAHRNKLRSKDHNGIEMDPQ